MKLEKYNKVLFHQIQKKKLSNVICSGNKFPTLHSVILAYSIPPDAGRSALLRAAVPPSSNSIELIDGNIYKVSISLCELLNHTCGQVRVLSFASGGAASSADPLPSGGAASSADPLPSGGAASSGRTRGSGRRQQGRGRN